MKSHEIQKKKKKRKRDTFILGIFGWKGPLVLITQSNDDIGRKGSLRLVSVLNLKLSYGAPTISTSTKGDAIPRPDFTKCLAEIIYKRQIKVFHLI